MSTTIQSSGGTGVLGLLGVVFVTLKLLGIISWSLLWVTAPFLGVLVLFVVIGLIALVTVLIIAALNKI